MGIHTDHWQVINNAFANHSHVCESLYSGKIFLNDIHVIVLIGFNIFVMALNVASNSAVIYILVSRKLLHNVSMRLILYLSVSDCVIATITQPLFILMLAKFSIHKNCTFDMIAQFIFVFTKHLSGYIIAVIAGDRYCKMRYLNRYFEVAQSWRLHGAVLIAILLSFLQGILRGVGTMLNHFEIVDRIALAIDLCVVLAVFLTYTQTVRVVRKHSNLTVNKTMINNVDQRVTSMASRILLALVLFYMPYVIMAALRPVIIDNSSGERLQNLHFVLFLTYELIFVNSFANAIIFLTLHQNCCCCNLVSEETYINRKNEHDHLLLVDGTLERHHAGQLNERTA